MIFLISLFLVLFSFANFFSSFAAVFSHNFRSTIFAGVAVGRDFLKQCEISRIAKFRNLRNFPGCKISQPGNFCRLQNSSNYEFSHKLQNSACALFIFFLPFHFPTTFHFLHSINFSIFFLSQPPTTFIYGY